MLMKKLNGLTGFLASTLATNRRADRGRAAIMGPTYTLSSLIALFPTIGLRPILARLAAGDVDLRDLDQLSHGISRKKLNGLTGFLESNLRTNRFTLRGVSMLTRLPLR